MIIDAAGRTLPLAEAGTIQDTGLMSKLILMTQRQLSAAYNQNVRLVKVTGSMEHWIAWIEESINMKLPEEQHDRWISYLRPFFDDPEVGNPREGIDEGSFVVRAVEWLTRHLQWRWYVDAFGDAAFTNRKLPALDRNAIQRAGNTYNRPHLPPSASIPLTPSVLPFHTVGDSYLQFL